jgi:GH25 family lysozyme M1 (1,4-beta-N-acetylmuramidase)
LGIKGIDVSGYQSATPNLSGADFCFIKATEGTGYTNPRMVAQAKAARAAGVVVGFYHYLHAGNLTAQAAYFVKQAASVAGDILWVDWEESGVSSADKDAFVREVQRLRGKDHRVGLYCNTSYWTTRDKSGFYGDALWIAVYNGKPGNPGIKAAWSFHQYTDKPVDTSVSTFTSRAALRAWAGKVPAPVKPAPKPAPKPAKPSVSLHKLITAAHEDPKAKQGHQTYAAGVKVVEAALRAAKLLPAAYAGDGSYGSTTITAYKNWQLKQGYRGKDADGIPGKATLTKLGAKYGFTVTA